MSTPEELPDGYYSEEAADIEESKRCAQLRTELEASQRLAADRLEQMQADRAQALVWRDECERLRELLDAAVDDGLAAARSAASGESAEGEV